jgi:CheY-like chemotaxis protein
MVALCYGATISKVRPMTCVLIVEDDPQTVEEIMAASHDHGFAVDSAGTGREGLLKAAAESCDAILFDRMPPGGPDGLGMLETLRTAGIEAPVLILSAQSGVDEQVRGLRAGGALRRSALPAMPDEYLRRGEGKPSRQNSARHLSCQALLVAAIPLLCTLLLPGGAALAQEARAPNEAPARISNIWGGFDHQPTKSQVQSAERASGVAPSAQEESREAQIERQLNRELLKSAGAGWTGAAAG